jgi:hypothetical protein
MKAMQNKCMKPLNNGYIICFLDSERKLIIPSPGIVICKWEALKIN